VGNRHICLDLEFRLDWGFTSRRLLNRWRIGLLWKFYKRASTPGRRLPWDWCIRQYNRYLRRRHWQSPSDVVEDRCYWRHCRCRRQRQRKGRQPTWFSIKCLISHEFRRNHNRHLNSRHWQSPGYVVEDGRHQRRCRCRRQRQRKGLKFIEYPNRSVHRKGFWWQ